MVVNVTKFSQKMKKKLAEFSKKYYRARKKYFNLENFASS